MKKIIYKNYEYQSILGCVKTDTYLYVEDDFINKEVDINKDTYYEVSEEIERASFLILENFFFKNNAVIKTQEKVLTKNELLEIKNILQLNLVDFSIILGLHKSSVTRMIKGELSISEQTSFIVMDLIKAELENKGEIKRRVQAIKENKKIKNHPISDGIDINLIIKSLIFKHIEIKSIITHLKLQKLLYYFSGVMSARFGIRPFDEDFKAWTLGPVLESVYNQYTICSDNDLRIPFKEKTEVIVLSKECESAIDEVMQKFGDKSANFLVNKTHNEGPWKDTKQSEIIPYSEIMKHFLSAYL